MRCFTTILVTLALFGGGCSSSNNNATPDAGASVKLGDNPSVPSTCQMCLAMSTSNECATKEKICTDNADCKKLNTCVNKCANVNAACVQSCGDSVSQDAIDAWNAWASCSCGTCDMQCKATFCSAGGGQCVADGGQCSSTQNCCTFCASDGVCGCIPPGDEGCQTPQDCCSGSCTQGVCD